MALDPFVHSPLYTIVRIAGAQNITILAFTITGPGPGPCGSLHYGVRGTLVVQPTSSGTTSRRSRQCAQWLPERRGDSCGKVGRRDHGLGQDQSATLSTIIKRMGRRWIIRDLMPKS